MSEKENSLNKFWLKYLIFTNCIKIYHHLKTLLEILKGPYKGLGSVRGPHI